MNSSSVNYQRENNSTATSLPNISARASSSIDPSHYPPKRLEVPLGSKLSTPWLQRPSQHSGASSWDVQRLGHFTQLEVSVSNTPTTIINEQFILAIAPYQTKQHLSDKAAKLIGKSGMERFELFKTLKLGWNVDGGLPLNSKSIECFERFVNLFAHRFFDTPSLFLTEEGNLALGWEDHKQNSLEIEFQPEGYLVFVSTLDEEELVDFNNEASLEHMLFQ